MTKTQIRITNILTKIIIKMENIKIKLLNYNSISIIIK